MSSVAKKRVHATADYAERRGRERERGREGGREWERERKRERERERERERLRATERDRETEDDRGCSNKVRTVGVTGFCFYSEFCECSSLSNSLCIRGCCAFGGTQHPLCKSLGRTWIESETVTRSLKYSFVTYYTRPCGYSFFVVSCVRRACVRACVWVRRLRACPCARVCQCTCGW